LFKPKLCGIYNVSHKEGI